MGKTKRLILNQKQIDYLTDMVCAGYESENHTARANADIVAILDFLIATETEEVNEEDK